MNRRIILSVLAMFCISVAAEDAPKWEDVKALLGKSIKSEVVQRFVKVNGLKVNLSSEGLGACANLEKVPFALEIESNVVHRICIAIRYKGYASYKGPLPFGLIPTDTPETVIRRLGQPSKRREAKPFTFMHYSSLGIQLDFNQQPAFLAGINICEK